MDARIALAAVAGGAAAILAYTQWQQYTRRKQEEVAVMAATSTLCEPCEPSAVDTTTSVLTPARPGAAATPSSSSSSSGDGDGGPSPRQALLGRPTYYGFSKDADSNTRRENYIDWHTYFMSIATLSAFRSKDPNRQVGACIVDPRTKKIVGIGYNGFPWGCSDDALPWARDSSSGWLDTKYPYVCHAEMNAILNKNCSDLQGCRIYTTLYPCNECAKLIVQSRMAEVVYLSDDQSGKNPFKASRRILDLAGIKQWKHEPTVPRVVIDFDDPLAK